MQASRFVLIAAVAALAACKPGANASSAPATPAADAGQAAVATVNGKDISRNVFDFFIKASTNKSAAELSPEQRTQALDALVRMEVSTQKAATDKLDQDKETAAMLEMSHKQVLMAAMQQKYLADKQPTDAELRAEYESQLAKMSRTEYHAHHILVQTETFANELMERLKKGAKFDDLAKKESMDEGSKVRGGDLGWFPAASMVKPFADAVITLKKGEMTAKPVQTQFGWHIIRLDETRDIPPPGFDQAREQLARIVLSNKFKAYQDELMKTAKVDKKPL